MQLIALGSSKQQQHLRRQSAQNNGKPIRETTAIDIPFAARHFHYFASVIETEEGII
jgi:acyl-CoA reductase-like NAD-dependent aldehyde dehydrogenase